MKTTPIARAFAFAAGLTALAAVAPAALAGEVAPAGELTVFSQPAPTMSTKTREERKAETLLARSRNELLYGGMGSYRGNTWLQTAVAHSTKTRAEGKSEARAAVQHGQTMRAGEAS